MTLLLSLSENTRSENARSENALSEMLSQKRSVRFKRCLDLSFDFVQDMIRSNSLNM